MSTIYQYKIRCHEILEKRNKKKEVKWREPKGEKRNKMREQDLIRGRGEKKKKKKLIQKK